MTLSVTLGPSKQPRYARVADSLMRDIAAGTYAVGDLLPPESILCERFSVSRATVREALRQLSELGLVHKAHGIGTRVTAVETQSNYLMSLDSVSGLMHYGTETVLRLIDRVHIVATPADVRLLGCAAGDRWIRLRGVRSIVGADKRPIAYSEIYIDDRFTDIANETPAAATYYEMIINRHGEELQSVEQEISAINIVPEIASMLAVKPDAAGLQIVRRYRCSRSQPIEVTLNYHPKDRFTYHLRLNRPPTK
ncbi:GntR family transcriptional regulator [Microvirga antarctica]|uniref:GntR family transcriptional regulator n=1 Tax=Microvirga antarctica TaxID=2819233 RepID=UPI002484B3CD|nr:GntR family transcriptional regulator [Microvirga antarctica]